MKAYYNENDPFAAAWLRALIVDGHIAPGDVDERSIEEISPSDLKGYTQCHFFAGIGGWSYALRLAGWPDERPVWTGSCPCQPFSSAGARKGSNDDRHLWPQFNRLIAAMNPEVIFGEQVASSEVVGTKQEADFVIAVQQGDYARANKLAKRLVKSKSFHAHRRWLDGVQADLEAAGYTFWHTVLGAHSAGAPHIRQRLWWVADANEVRHTPIQPESARRNSPNRENRGSRFGPQRGGSASGVDDAKGKRGRSGAPMANRRHTQSGRSSSTNRVVDANMQGSQGRTLPGERPDQQSPWASGVAIPCTDGKARRVEPGIFPLADGVSNRVGLLRGYGNAIVPQVAAKVIKAYYKSRSAINV